MSSSPGNPPNQDEAKKTEDFLTRVYGSNKRSENTTGESRYKISEPWDKQEPYIPAPSLVDAVNTALYLRRPLLLEGEPGGGKTRLAFSVAYELGYPLYECYIRSTSRAQDLLYEYDALGRLYDIQEAKTAGSSGEGNPPKKREKYLTYGGLGQAIVRSAKENIPSVVLIDEIDKADIDFPNDLLLELDQLKFQVKEVPELGEINALKPEGSDKEQTRDERKHFLPLVIVTSNREKELPKPFLRRCLFYYIDFPAEKELEVILKSHFREHNSKLFDIAISILLKLRKRPDLRKKPGISEFLDWVRMLGGDGQKIDENVKNLQELEGKLEREQLKGEELFLPYQETLIKTQSDHIALFSNTNSGSKASPDNG